MLGIHRMKKCAQCQRLRKLSLFSMNSTSHDGHRHRCIYCTHPNTYVEDGKTRPCLKCDKPIPKTKLRHTCESCFSINTNLMNCGEAWNYHPV